MPLPDRYEKLNNTLYACLIKTLMEDVSTFVLFQRMCGALKYTIGFLIVGIVLLLVG